MFGLSGPHIIMALILLVIVLIIVGPGKLPDVGAGLGRAIREFRKASTETVESVRDAVTEKPAPPPAAVAPAPVAPAADALKTDEEPKV